MKTLAELVRPNIRTLNPYSTARDEYAGGEISTWLDANENPYDNGVNRYPDPHQRELKRLIARIKGVREGQVFIGNGSDEAIDLAYRIFCTPGRDNAVAITPTYGMYRVAADINGVKFREVRLGHDFSLPRKELLAATDARTKLMWICTPNNPTGNAFATEDIEYLLRRFDGMVVLDEAYIDFASDGGFLPRLDRFGNLIILQTLSKAWGMAGLRLGLAFAQEEVIEMLSRVKYPYNINVVTQKLVFEQLDKPVDAQIREIVSERRRLTREMEKLPLIRQIFPSDANFLLVRVDAPRELYNRLIDAGIIVRDRSRIRGCEGCLRISVGTPAENDRLLDVLKNLDA